MAATKTRNTYQTVDWPTLKHEWMAKNMSPSGPPFTLKELAVRYGVVYGTVKNRAHREGWRVELTEALAERDKQATTEVMSRAVWDVAEVRWRQARIARVAMTKAMAALAKIDVDKLTASEAIRLLDLGLEQERRALGIAVVTRIEHERAPQDDYESVEERMDKVKQFRDLADRFSVFVAGKRRRNRAQIAAK